MKLTGGNLSLIKTIFQKILKNLKEENGEYHTDEGFLLVFDAITKEEMEEIKNKLVNSGY